MTTTMDDSVIVLRNVRSTAPRSPSRDAFVVNGHLHERLPALPARATELIDCDNAYLVPGLVDMHGHVDTVGFDAGVPADQAHLLRGVVAINDGGSVGADGFPVFLEQVVRRSRARITAYLNASATGIRRILVGEYGDLGTLRIDAAVTVARRHPNIVRGIKVRLGRRNAGENPLPVLAAGLQIAREAGLPLMAHIGDTTCSLSEILTRLRPGDIVTHCFHGKAEGILEHGRPAGTVIDARAKGVLFDV